MKERYAGSITDVKPLIAGRVWDEKVRTGVTVVVCNAVWREEEA